MIPFFVLFLFILFGVFFYAILISTKHLIFLLHAMLHPLSLCRSCYAFETPPSQSPPQFYCCLSVLSPSPSRFRDYAIITCLGLSTNKPISSSKDI